MTWLEELDSNRSLHARYRNTTQVFLVLTLSADHQAQL